MKKEEKVLTGVVTWDEQPINFYADNYKFTFMSIDDNNYFIKPQDGFIYGRTHNENKIAIYTGKSEVNVRRVGYLNTGSYIVSRINTFEHELCYYDAVIFSGGILNDLLIPNNFDDELMENGDIMIHFRNDKKEYSFFIDECECLVKIFSSGKTSRGRRGLTITNDTINFEFLFSERQPLKSIYKCIGKFKEILSIMTFRRNIGFDEIELCQYLDVFGGKLRPVADVFIKEDKKNTEKSYINNIGFEDLGKAIEELLSIVFNSKDNKPSYSFGFIPENDSSVNIMTNSKLKEICSALECELSFIDDIKNEENKELEELRLELKKIVKNHRKGANALAKKTYDLIFSSMDHWTLSASDRIIELYHRFEEEMINLNPSSTHITDDLIGKVVKYRNKITHGSYRILNMDIAITAHVLSGLVYCCFLKRIGITDEKIKELCVNKILW